jgi:hypothetical protein
VNVQREVLSEDLGRDQGTDVLHAAVGDLLNVLIVRRFVHVDFRCRDRVAHLDVDTVAHGGCVRMG